MPPITRRYGPGARQSIDVFAPRDAQDAPVFLLVHGGAWRLSMREAFYGSAPILTAAGCVLAVVGFDCLPDVSLVQMAEQVRQAVFWVAAEIGALGGNPRNIHLVGHSSGAHLAAVTLTGDLGPAAASVRGGTLISGLYDLAPVMLSSRGAYIDLAPEAAVALSPIHRPAAFMGAGSVWWGTDEAPEFARQSVAFADALRMAGKLHRSGPLPGRNHFEMLEEIEDPDSPLMTAMIAAAHG
jgi:arylformamidase